MKRGVIHFLVCLLFLVTVGACTKLCDSGYEGKNCNIEVRAAFEGVWNAVDTPGNKTYTDTISPASYVGDVTISKSFSGNFFANPINASVSGNSISIGLQEPDDNLYFVQGTGTINQHDSIINWTYQIINQNDSPAIVVNYAGVWTK